MNTPTGTTPRRSSAVTPPTRLEAARERAIVVLTDRYADGLLDDTGLEDGLTLLHAAGTPAEVDDAVAELMALAGASRQVEALVPHVLAERRILAIAAETHRKGRWAVPRLLRVRAIMAEVKIDLRHATLPPEVTIDVRSVMARVLIIVPPGVSVAMDTFAMFGTAVSTAPEPATGASVIRVLGSAVFGEVRVAVRGD